MKHINDHNYSSIQWSILECLTYFKIFEHPLSIQEIERLCNISGGEGISHLNILVEEEKVFCHKHYYTTASNVTELYEMRMAKEAEAKKYFLKLKKYGVVLAAFPFVRGIAVSGSLSKGVMNPDGDIDYFIITKSGRLWMCRTMMVLFKKAFLLNSKKYFCVNYFVDEQNLQIRDKNIFTATEFIHLIPLYSHKGILDDFRFQNRWINKFYSKVPEWRTEFILKESYLIKKMFEIVLRFSVFDKLETYCHKLTLKYWRKKFGHFREEKFELTMRSTKGISKHHPSDFQTKVLTTFNKEMNNLVLHNTQSMV